MFSLLKKMKRRELAMAMTCIALVLGQIYFDLKLPDFMSDLTILVKTPGTAASAVWDTGLQMLGCTLASAVLAIGCGFLAAKVAAGLSYTVRGEIFNKVTDFGQREMLQFSVPSLINRTTNDITAVQMFVSMGLQIIIKAPVMAVWAVIKIIGKSETLSLITAGFVVALLGAMLAVIIIVLPRVRRVQKLTDAINLVARENLTGISVVHAFNAETYQNEKFAAASENLKNTQLFNQRTFAVLMPYATLVMNALSMVIYWVGASIINNVPAAQFPERLMTFGNIVVFGTYATYVLMSIMMLVMIVMFLPSAQVSAQRINEVLRADNRLQQGKQTTADEVGTVEFRAVSFRYPSSAKDVLCNISFTASKGETVAFIGATGSGKTTLINLAARLYDATQGAVLLDGKDIRDYTFDALYNRVALVTQRANLFSGSIRDNILFGESEAAQTADTVSEALSLAQASEFVDTLPKGMDAPITQGGGNVSGGQKQRLSIARALARKPEIIIFDDSFSALDYKTDRALRKALDEQLCGTTRLIVAQRIGTIRDADKIIVLDAGQIVGIGTHTELLHSCDIYREIAYSQLSAAELDD